MADEAKVLKDKLAEVEAEIARLDEEKASVEGDSQFSVLAWGSDAFGLYHNGVLVKDTDDVVSLYDKMLDLLGVELRFTETDYFDQGGEAIKTLNEVKENIEGRREALIRAKELIAQAQDILEDI